MGAIEKKRAAHERARDTTHAGQLAAALKLDMADYCKPTVDSYLGRVSKEQILEAVKETCGTEGTVEVAGLKKGDLPNDLRS